MLFSPMVSGLLVGKVLLGSNSETVRRKILILGPWYGLWLNVFVQDHSVTFAIIFFTAIFEI